ncbi:hypothetical protein, partial [Clavibacter michiganensis]|uniref:hypothetical protein n=1 Tax=Clavibacter michiganensis TaxID=28447 RepID=UPI00292DA8C0
MSALLDATPHEFQPGAGTGPVILGLHGTGADERQGLELARILAPGQPVLAPRGSVREGSAARWFRRHAEGVFDVDDVVARAADLAGLVAEARAAYALGDREILAVGFSNGANMALATTLLHPSALPSTIAFSARWPLGDREPAADLSGARITLLGTPLHRALLAGRPGGPDEIEVLPVAHGVRDVPGTDPDPAEIEAFAARMRARRFDLAMQVHGGGRNSNPFLLRLGARHTVGTATDDAERLERVIPYVYYQHEVLRGLEVAGLAGAPVADLEPVVEVTDAERAAASER